MKTTLSILLSIVVLFSSLGFTVKTHYCGKKKERVEFSAKKSCCQKSSMPKGCCKNEVQHLKVKEGNTVYLTFKFTPLSKLIATVSYFILDWQALLKLPSYFNSIPFKVPKFSSKASLCIILCKLTI